MAGTYIWSGLHKANPTFYELWLNGLNKRVPFIPLFLRQVFTWSVPFLEMFFGLSLLFNKTRRLCIIMLSIMHAMILVTYVYGGVSYMVFPLNIINVLFLFMLCFNYNLSILELKNINIKIKIIAIYALVLPSLNLVGLYDHLLAFSYFSSKPRYCNIIFLNEDSKDKVPVNIKDILREYEGKYYLSINEWSAKHVNLMCYPEDRIYKYLQDYVEDFTGENSTYLQYYKK